MDIETYALTKSPDYNKLKNRPFYERKITDRRNR